MIKIQLSNQLQRNTSIVTLLPKGYNPSDLNLNSEEQTFFNDQANDKQNSISFNRYSYQEIYILIDQDKTAADNIEKSRKAGADCCSALQKYKVSEVTITDKLNKLDLSYAFCEGFTLQTYSFVKYFKDKQEKENTIKTLNIQSVNFNKSTLNELIEVSKAVFFARDLVNEPVIYLTAEQLVKDSKKYLKGSGLIYESFDKKKIEELKMGGLLSVNKGSIDPPTFSIISWKPDNAKNKKPYVLVGKGVVYDTGGLSLKPTPNSMDQMKCDMAGAATVIGTMYAIAKLNLPVHVIGLVPATDNRPDGNAYAPGDVITMFDGTTVEVKNTDAEGRLILADAIAYSKRYKPQLVMTIATLTGAAAFAIGPYGLVAMGNAKEKYMSQLKESGSKTNERVAEFPFWDEYGKSLQSDIADISNLGMREGGAISAGKFLEHFTKDPFIHLDIAGPAFLNKPINYFPKGGTGFGIRMLVDFFKSFC